jgi:hypothetical protein
MASSDFSTSCRSPRGEFFLGDVWHYLISMYFKAKNTLKSNLYHIYT